MLHYYDLKISEVFIYENYLINQIREGTHIEPDHTKILQEALDTHFRDKPLVYIANRVNSYSVDPFTYNYVAKMENLVALAIVTYTERGREIAQFEKDFYSKPFRICDTVTEAIAWSYELLDIPV